MRLRDQPGGGRYGMVAEFAAEFSSHGRRVSRCARVRGPGGDRPVAGNCARGLATEFWGRQAICSMREMPGWDGKPSAAYSECTHRWLSKRDASRGPDGRVG